MDTVEGLRDAARRAWERAVMGQAVMLARSVCVKFRGDSPVEHWCEKEPEEPEPFGLKEVNRRLAALRREPA